MLLEPNGINNSACSRNSPCELNFLCSRHNDDSEVEPQCENKKEGGGHREGKHVTHVYITCMHICFYAKYIYIYMALDRSGAYIFGKNCIISPVLKQKWPKKRT